MPRRCTRERERSKRPGKSCAAWTTPAKPSPVPHESDGEITGTTEVYKRLGQPETLAAVPLDSAAVLPPKKCMKPCALSIWPPPVIREELNARGLQPAA